MTNIFETFVYKLQFIVVLCHFYAINQNTVELKISNTWFCVQKQLLYHGQAVSFKDCILGVKYIICSFATHLLACYVMEYNNLQKNCFEQPLILK